MTLQLRAGQPDFEATFGAKIRQMPCFRVPTDDEVDLSYAAYLKGDPGHLCDVWQEIASPTRALVPFPASVVYPRLGYLPRGINAASFLITVRAGLAAGVRFREALRPQSNHAIAHDFPWLENRHLHIPDGFTPMVDFPDVFRAFIDAPNIDDMRARWQLAAALNEVQQSAYTRYAATLFRLPELARHADRERTLAINYLSHWSPTCSPELWRQTVWVLDALNAAIFDWVCNRATALVMSRSTLDAFGPGWRTFVAALDAPPPLVPAPAANPRRYAL